MNSSSNSRYKILKKVPMASFIEISTVDWEKGVVSVFFLYGCNLSCPWCHNSRIAQAPLYEWSLVSFEDCKKMVEEQVGKDWLDGILISGGEPLLYLGLPDFLIFLKEELGLPLLLDTNGTLPRKLLRVLPFLQEVRMDIKAPLDRPPLYQEIVGNDLVDLRGIYRSLLILATTRKGRFRTTVIPGKVERQEVMEIARLLGDLGVDSEFFSINPYSTRGVQDNDYQKLPCFEEEEIRQWEMEAKEMIRKISSPSCPKKKPI